MRNWTVVGIVLAVTVVIFAPLWNAGPLTWDDNNHIFGNPFFTMHHWSLLLTEPYFGMYVPVTSSVWALLYNFGGGTVWPFRALNLVLHGANIVMVFLLLQGWAKRLNWSSTLAPALAVTVFAFHPLQVETVAWISGGRDLLAAFFALLALLLYYHHGSRWGAGLAFTLGLFSKPSLSILPLAILIIDVFSMHLSWRASLKRMLPWFLLSAAAIVITQLAQQEHFVNRIQFWERPLVMVDNYRFYVEKLLAPVRLSANYGRTPEVVVREPLNWLWDGIFVIAVGLTLWTARRRTDMIMALWFVLLLPVSGIVPFGYENVSGVADHYVYLPMVFIAAGLVWLCHQRWEFTFVIFIASLAWAIGSYDRVEVWKDDDAFFTDMSKISPQSYNTALGMSLVMCAHRQDYGRGLEWVDRALAVKPEDILALANRAYCLLHAGQLKLVSEMESVLLKLDVKDLAANRPTGLSSLLASIGSAEMQTGELQKGFAHLCEANHLLPADATHIHNLQAGRDIMTQHGLPVECPKF